MRRSTLIPVLFLLAALAAPAVADDVDPVRCIGMDLGAAVTTFGLPRGMFTWRGTDQTRDNVVFFYPDSLYLFWFRDRVWQVRFDRRYTAPVLGLSLGMSRVDVEQSGGRRYVEKGDSLYFDLVSAGFPLRVRLVFEAGVLSDLYVYRSDY